MDKNCSDIKTSLLERCNDMLHSKEKVEVFVGGRSGKTFNLLQILKQNIEMLPPESEKPFVIMMSESMLGVSVQEHAEVIELLKSRNIEIICMSNKLSASRIIGHFGHSFAQLHDTSKLASQVMKDLTIEIDRSPLDEPVQLKFYQDHSKPINKGVGKMSMKGKTGYQLGSKFHR